MDNRLQRQRALAANISLGFAVATDGDWDEGKHPRGADGKFGEGGGAADHQSASSIGKVSTHVVPKSLQERTEIQIGDRMYTDKPGLYQLSPGAMNKALEQGSFSTMTAANPMGKHQPAAVNERMNEELKKDLMNAGAIFHAGDGVYTNDEGETNHEPSFMVHHLGRITPAFIEGLANKYNQESCLHYTKNDTTIRYVSGDKMGQDMLKLKGHTTEPEPTAPQTVIPGAGKFAMGSEEQKQKRQFGFVIKTDDGKSTRITFGGK